jgi:hypothetical protein
MALKRLFSEEMLQISGTLTDPKSKAHKAIVASADLAPSMPRLTAAHDVLAQLTQPVDADPRLAAIIAEEGVIDPRHDDLIRGAHALLTGAAFLLGEDGADLLALRDSLFPDGLSSTQKSYRAEAGQAAQLAARLTPALRARLASIAVGPKSEKKKTLEHFVDELLTLGARLGVLEDEKGRLQAGAAEQAGSGLGAALLAARNQWVRVANSLVANGELAGLDPETDKLVFGPLRAAEKAADRRAASAPAKKKAGADPSAPEAIEPGDRADAIPTK